MKISPKRVALVLGIGSLILIVLHVLACIPMVLIEERAYPLGILSLDGEKNIPAMYSTVLLWFNAFIFLCITGVVPRKAYGKSYWFGLFLIFLFLGLDESIEIHERCMEVVKNVVGASGIFHFSWVIPYGLGLMALGLLYLKFYLKLPKDTRILMFVAAVLFVGGAMGIEMLSGLIIESLGKGVVYYIAVMFEEGLEMAGSIVLIYTFLRYIELYVPGFSISISSEQSEA
jgi:hypothetical protein